MSSKWAVTEVLERLKFGGPKHRWAARTAVMMRYLVLNGVYHVVQPPRLLVDGVTAALVVPTTETSSRMATTTRLATFTAC